jgi:hypothetical protein
VKDLLFKCSLTPGDRGLLTFSLFSDEDCFEMRLDFDAERFELRRNTDSIVSGKFIRGLKRRSLELEFAVVDQQVMFVVNGRTWVRHLFSAGNVTKEATLTELDAEHPLMIAADHLEVQVHRIQLYRDIYWSGPAHTEQEWRTTSRLHANEYLLVGDNVPVSEDCRHWGRGIMREEILGKVLRNRR